MRFLHCETLSGSGMDVYVCDCVWSCKRETVIITSGK